MSWELNSLMTVLTRLEDEKELTKLVDEKRYKEVNDVMENLDYDSIYHCLENITLGEKLELSDIPGKYRVTCLLLLSVTEYDELHIFGVWNRDEVIEDVEKRGTVGALLANYMHGNFIKGFDSIEELMKAAEEKMKKNIN